MRKLLSVLLFTLFCALATPAQNETQNSAQWQIFAPRDEEFSVEVPRLLTNGPFSTESASRRYYNLVDGTYFFVFSDKINDSFQYKYVTDFAKRSDQNGVSEKIGNFEALKYQFEDAEQFYHTIVSVKTQNRAYIFQTVSPTQDNPTAARFFESLKINEKTSGEILDSTKVEKEIVIDVPTQQNETVPDRNNSGKGNGSRSGGVGGGIGFKNNPGTTPVTPPSASTQSTPLRILSKPRATYTDEARFYGISGKVVLRVAFLAEGNIGSVSAVSKLPFGLTAMAVEAAKGVRFEPAVRDGKAISVTKMIEYNFTIY